MLLALLVASCGTSRSAASAATERPVQTDGTAELAARVDAVLAQVQAADGVQPAPRCDDATFLRRATLDLTGTLPEPQVVRAFLADPRSDKRARAVDALLASPDYATHWTAYWDDVLMGPGARSQILDRGAFRRWLERELAQNAPWNQLVFDLVSATGQNSVGGEEARPRFAQAPQVVQAEARADVNGAVNWLLKYRDAPQDLAGSTSRIFLGVQIQCAQCHDHKTEKWKQTDFRQFAAAFARTRPFPIDLKGEMKGIRRVEVRDVDYPVGRGKKAPPEWQAIVASEPTALDGTDLGSSRVPRRALAGWIVSDTNPWFAQALVNRYWAVMTGRGFVDPLDDLRPSNPAIAPEALAALAQDFKTHGYDLKRLLRTICLSDAYQRAAVAVQPGKSGDDDWARARLRTLEPDQLLNSVVAATQLQPALAQRADKQGKSVAQLEMDLQRQVTFLFDVDEEAAADDYAGTVPQAQALLNGGW